MSEMDQQQPKHQEAPRTPNEPAGVMLRRERERQGLSLEDVALQLNLRPTVVAGLEEDRFDQVPIAAYRRGYVRAYARLMGMDETAVVNAYDATHGRADIERKLVPVNTAKPPSRVGAWLFRLFTLLVIIGLVALTLLWWQSREGNDVFGGGDDAPVAVDSFNDDDTTGSDDNGLEPNADTVLPPVPTRQNTPQVDNEASLPADDTASDAANSDGVSASAETSTPDADERQAQQVATLANTVEPSSETPPNTDSATSDSAAASDDTTLSLTFSEESWTEIYDANDDRIFSGLQPAGSQATAEGEPPFRLTIGNASGVTLDYRGEPIDLSQYTGGNNVARFTLGD
ncbi:RodZ domain-containing protein [Salinicola peritrichatus]|uniref:RodZ domain-containing protein n=1 Tax=Salinicola peritrichatus TaxID=1267424 RepID=UPI000DA18148|nr:RodZ domain-containing protein [Salinicola peritrichatus]